MKIEKLFFNIISGLQAVGKYLSINVFFLLAIGLFFANCININAQQKIPVLVEYNSITVGAQQVDNYLPKLKDKKIAMLVNNASKINGKHLVDILLSKGVAVKIVFSPEHGYRGGKDAGEVIKDEQDAASGIPVISLYGKSKKPTSENLNGIDILMIDLQDVGTRFYTYISTMSLAMEACAENDVKVVVLDRPNPNGYFVDGPVLKKEFSSFVGMHPVPVVYGMTIGEYAQMVNGEGWLKAGVKCDLQVVPLKGYNHNMIVKLQTAPSPNLPNWKSVYLYPSLCFFEGTVVSVGRGTQYPFQVYGHPDLPLTDFSFTPHSIPGKSSHPKWQGEVCYGRNLSGYANSYQNKPAEIHLQWLISSYNYLSNKTDFFNNYFDKLAGSSELREQIIAGKTQDEIRVLWQKDLNAFKKVRKKYLLYD